MGHFFTWRWVGAGFVVSAVSVLLGCGADAPLPPVRRADYSPHPTEAPAARPATGPRSEACDALRAQLAGDFSELRRCHADEQCNFVDESFTVIDRHDPHQKVVTLQCGAVTPLLVTAQGAKVSAMKLKLATATQAQAKACAEDPADANPYPCEDPVTVSSATPPVCARGVCQVAY